MDISTFSVNFLAEIGLDTFVVVFWFLFSYKGKKWKLPLIVYVPIMTILYLHIIRIPILWSLVAWCLAMPCGLLIFVKNIQASAYSSIIFPNSKSEKTQLKVEEKKAIDSEVKVSLEENVKSIEYINYILLSVAVLVAISSGIQNFPTITQTPIFWITLFITLGLIAYYRFTNRKSIESNLLISLKILLASTYLLMSLGFASVYFYLTDLFHFSVLTSLTFACVVVMAVFAFNTYIFNNTKKAIFGSKKKTEVLARFIWILNKSKLINLAFIIALSDFPIIIGLMLTQNNDLMFMWAIGFFIFIGTWLHSTIREDVLLRIDANLTNKGEISSKLRKLV
jgi:hypothetical protein